MYTSDKPTTAQKESYKLCIYTRNTPITLDVTRTSTVKIYRQASSARFAALLKILVFPSELFTAPSNSSLVLFFILSTSSILSSPTTPFRPSCPNSAQTLARTSTGMVFSEFLRTATSISSALRGSTTGDPSLVAADGDCNCEPRMVSAGKGLRMASRTKVPVTTCRQ